jgi:AAHS family 4-hydroxybenzoate transporter-like MFS transporter
MKAVDVGSVLDAGDWTRYQKVLVAVTALTIVLDGFDNQLMGIAVLPLMREWQVSRAAFAPVLASGMVGMMIGGAIGGFIGDRLGRRAALLGSVAVFGALTALTPMVGDVFTLGVLRFLTGLGLGGAMPNSAALVSEYVPIRHRPFAVTLTIVCIPIGGTVAGIVGAQVLPQFGWRALFLAGGIVPLAVAITLWKALPESPRYLARHSRRWPELARLLRRLGHDTSDDTAFVDAAEQAVVRVSPRELLSPEFQRDTLALSASFFFCLLSVYVGVNWVPSMLAGAGFDVAVAGNGLAAFNLGGVAGALVGAGLIRGFGSRSTMLAMSAGAVAGAVVIAAAPLGSQSSFAILVMLAWTGGWINGVQVTMYALAAHVYPTGIRATGVGTAVAIGRLGGVLSTYAGSWALESGGAPQLFTLLAMTMSVVFVALASVKRHIPRATLATVSHVRV